MAYTPTVWATGDVITADLLNKAENGIADASVAELPSVSGTDEGKVLTVDSSGDWVADNLPAELPSVSDTDEGKVLTVDSSGDWSAAYPVSYDKTFIYNLSIDAGTGAYAITIDASSPVPAVEDFTRPERNRVKLVFPANMMPGIGYLGLFLPLTMEAANNVSDDPQHYYYSATGALNSALVNFSVTFSLSQAGVSTTLAVTPSN